MFGYIHPVRGDLKVREFEEFQACYCGMCHCLGETYGPVSRLILNFDFVYLAMLLWRPEEKVSFRKRRCVVSPFRKKCCCNCSPALEKAAGLSVILTWWKLRDTVCDEHGIKRILACLAAGILKPAYKKAAGRYPVFAEEIHRRLEELTELEKAQCDSIDKAADPFALLLAGASNGETPESRQRELRQILYHTGRWIYIIDAGDDLPEDFEKHRYNVLAKRFSLNDGKLDETSTHVLEVTLAHSRNLCVTALELMPPTVWTSTLRNIMELGMAQVGNTVLAGKWPRRRFSGRLRNDKI